MSGNKRIDIVKRIAILLSLVLFAFGAKPEKADDAAKKEPTEKATVKGVAKAGAAEAAQVPVDEKETARLAMPAIKVDDVTVTLGAIESMLSEMTPMQVGDLKNEEKMDAFLYHLVKTELMAKEARRRGHEADPEVTSIYKNKLASLMHRHIVDEADKTEPTDADLRKYYDDHAEDYHKPEKARARHILISDKTKAEELLKKVIAEKTKQQDFRKIAKESTEDEETKQQGGDLGFFTKTGQRAENDKMVDPAIIEAAFSLKVNGDIYPKLVKTDRGFHIVMLTGHRTKMDFSYEDSKDRLAILVKREMRKNIVETSIEKLKERFPVQVFEENLQNVVIEAAGKDVAEPGGKAARQAPGGRNRVN